MLVQIHAGTLALGGKVLFDEIGVTLAAGDRVGLVGPNGAGKSTLLRVLAGHTELDSGSCNSAGGVRLGYLPQDMVVEHQGSLLSFVLAARPSTAAEAELDAHASEYGAHHAHRLLAGLGFAPQDAEQPLSTFSGGWQMRAVLASLLFARPDVLLLDEPTNHLDMPTVAWLSRFLRRYRGTFVLISHDREFLNEQVDRILALEPEGLRSYRGNYDVYCQQRESEETLLANRARNLAREREKAEAFIRRFRAQATKAKAVQSRIKALEKMPQVTQLKQASAANFRFPPSPACSRHVMRAEGLSKAFDGRTVLHPITFQLSRGQRVGVVGLNGAGKSTLLRILAGDLGADDGKLDIGHGVVVGHFAQDHAAALDNNFTAVQTVQQAAPDATPTQVRTLLGTLLFTGDDADKPVGVLSGGERARVALARLMIAGCNVLLLDEPTNHLDLYSCERLIQALQSFDGTLVFISHDRAFVRALAQDLWVLDYGRLEPLYSGLDAYLATAGSAAEDAVDGDKSTAGGDKLAPSVGGTPGSGPDGIGRGGSEALAPQLSVSKRDARRARARLQQARAAKLGPLQKRVAGLEEEIVTLEETQAEREQTLQSAEIMADAEKLANLSRAYQESAQHLEHLTEAWEAAAGELEAAQDAFATENPALPSG